MNTTKLENARKELLLKEALIYVMIAMVLSGLGSALVPALITVTLVCGAVAIIINKAIINNKSK